MPLGEEPVEGGPQVLLAVIDGDDALEAHAVGVEGAGERTAVAVLGAAEQDLGAGHEDRGRAAGGHSVTAATRPLGSTESSVSVGPGTTGLPLTTSVIVPGRSSRIR